ncbi:MAG: LTA synthase family protein, partial [Lachnospiraceae bacterium]|nr:LTA synthase family protein [Lachnospiraceae bacterium]
MGTTMDLSKKDEYVLTTEGMLEVDDENNVIVFVLDWFDGQIFDWIENEDPAFLKPLSDFTYYKNTTSCYAYTTLSVPYMLSGVKYDNENTQEEWCSNAYTDKSLLWQIDSLGYDIGVYTEYQLLDPSLKDIIVNYSDAERRCRSGYSVRIMLRCAGYKNMPFILKDRFAYSTDDITALSIEENEYMTNTDAWIYNDLIQKKLKVEDKKAFKGAFRFLHLKGAHLPIVMNENCEALGGDAERTHENWLSQAKGSMRILYEYIEQMKQLGVYENATIVITADHGQNIYMDNDRGLDLGFKEHTSNPILLVKQSGVTQKEAMTVSEAPTSHEEFGASILKAMGGD